MEWFRLYHDFVSDPKIRLMAKLSKTEICHVGMVWLSVFTCASKADQRGCIAKLDPDEVASNLDLDVGVVNAVLAVMRDRGIIEGDTLAAFTKRQFRGEDSTAAARQQKHKEKASSAVTTPLATVSNGEITVGNGEITGQNASEQSRAEQSRAGGCVEGPKVVRANTPPVSASNEKLPDDTDARIRSLADRYPSAEGYEPGCQMLVQFLQSAVHPLRLLEVFETNTPLWIGAIAAGDARVKSWLWFVRDRDWERPPKVSAPPVMPPKREEIPDWMASIDMTGTSDAKAEQDRKIKAQLDELKRAKRISKPQIVGGNGRMA